MLSKRILEMPKIDLHCHLDGSLPKDVLENLLGRAIASSELKVSENCSSLSEYLTKFDLPLSCLQTAEAFRMASKEFLLSLQEDNIKYVEVRFAPQLSVREGLGCKKIMEAVLDGLETARAECGIHYGVIACMMRHHTEEQNLRMLKECGEFLGEGLYAVDLAGDESGFPTKKFYELFRQAKRMGYPFTIHAGECGDVNSIRCAIEWGASRIGHGIAMSGVSEVQKLCVQKHIGVELCPISNYQTRAVAPNQKYPLEEFEKNGVFVTINTDNRTVSGTNITKEMEFLQTRLGICEEQLRKYQLNAVEMAFCNDEVKHFLWKELLT